ncbi:MAG TPA: glycoside hydrolase family 99-like domain-containing protein [Candidatus Merdenecus merdavium]|nr:glycoside hydrolase family 99-like domain-containing protein [Candidatus Merdenecus merdavium]
MNGKINKVRAIAFYLPQFHPTQENDDWWGKGFTEWTNVAKARPLFPGHYQPHIPADLGFYDLRLPEARKAQADLAKKYGIEGFCYWHYWFAGKKLLERPFEEVLKSKEPDFPFCLGWANHSWQRKLWNYDGSGNKMLIEQQYPGESDIVDHFQYVLPAFLDERYIKVNGCPVFVIFAPLDYPQINRFMQIWRDLAIKHGLNGVYFVGQGNLQQRRKVLDLGFDAFNVVSVMEILRRASSIWSFVIKVRARVLKWPIKYDYKAAMKYWINEEAKEIDTIPSIISGWDHTPRSGVKGTILTDATPERFYEHVCQVVDLLKNKPYDQRLVFIKSWNEWGEGNYLEPDLKYHCKHLEALKSAILIEGNNYKMCEK